MTAMSAAGSSSRDVTLGGSQLATTGDSVSERHVINAQWLLTLRWVAVVGQLTTIGVAWGVLGVRAFWPLLGVGLAVTALTNTLFALWLRSLGSTSRAHPSARTWHAVFTFLMLLDLVVLTLLLYFTGGVHNPFIVFFFVNLALCGILLPARAAWGLTGVSIASYTLLSFWHIPLNVIDLTGADAAISASHLKLYDRGALVAFTTCAIVIVYFTTRLTGEVLRNHEELRRSELLRSRAEKWEALGTLAAGAAHELSSPLATIKIVLHELQRRLRDETASPEVLSEIEVVRGELQRCRAILDRMSIEAGHMATESRQVTTVGQLLTITVAGLGSDGHRVQVTMENDVAGVQLSVPLESLAQALRSIVQNGLDAAPDRPVQLRVWLYPPQLRIQVVDQGQGMSADVLARCDEPFFTTKSAGSGMGLGRFLARTVIERLGGSMATDSAPAAGTTVTISLPVESRPAAAVPPGRSTG